MRAWNAIGTFIGHNMIWIAPTCVLMACLFPEEIGLMRPAVAPLFALVSFQGALKNTFQESKRAFTRPLPLILVLIISTALIPALAFVLGSAIFPGKTEIICGILLEFSVPIAALSAMWCTLSGGNQALTLALLLTSSLICPFTLPVSMRLLLGKTIQVDVASMMLNLLLTVALPVVAATCINDRGHGVGEKKLSSPLAPAARLASVAIISANASNVAPYMRHLTPELAGVMVFIGVFTATGYLWGLGAGKLLRLPRESIVSMSYGTGMRNISAGAILAAAYFPAESMFPVIIGTLFQQVLAAIFGKIFERILPKSS
ncbi:MAG: bile acid:sodium symporter family protein [Atopobiaceae bacterium]|jgi:BASS family bile acid:Na+ symporter